MLINKVNDDACQWNGHDRWDVFIERFVCCMTRRKAEHSVTLWQRCTPLCTRRLFVVNTLTVFLSFCYIECELFAVFIKILFDNWRRFCRPSVIYVPVKCPRGGGIWLPEWTLCGAFERHFGPGRGGIWTVIFKKVKCPGSCPGGMLKLRFDRYINCQLCI